MKANRFGRILIASSFATFIPSINSGLYASSKIALDSLVRVMAAELGNYNITVNSYAPGMIPTGMSGIEKMEDFKKERMINTLAINRFGSGHQIAELLLFLASPRSEYITGTKIDISGGKFCVQFKD
jgi:3-oxoacyl-[acyl-carrier protein] reductase